MTSGSVCNTVISPQAYVVVLDRRASRLDSGLDIELSRRTSGKNRGPLYYSAGWKKNRPTLPQIPRGRSLSLFPSLSFSPGNRYSRRARVLNPATINNPGVRETVPRSPVRNRPRIHLPSSPPPATRRWPHSDYRFREARDEIDRPE